MVCLEIRSCDLPNVSQTAGADFEDMDEELVFQEGATTASQQCFSFRPIDDFEFEPTEDISIMATSDDSRLRFVPGRSIASIDILDNGKTI